MTTLEFNSKIESANTVSELNKLRSVTGASKFVSMIKEKVVKVAPNEGFERFECSLSVLRSLTVDTNTNSLIEIEIPQKNRIFSKYAGKKAVIYINHKEGSNFPTIYGFVKLA